MGNVRAMKLATAVMVAALVYGGAGAARAEPTAPRGAGGAFELSGADDNLAQSEDEEKWESPDNTISVTLGAGVTAYQGLDGGVYALDANDDLVFAATAPSTGDGVDQADGSWMIDGDSATATVPSQSDSTPIVALASTGLIAKVTVSSEKGKPRYLIAPTTAGRVAPSLVHAGAGWKEARAEGVGKGSQSLKNQYVCHPQSEAARVKKTWNIEAWRPQVSFPATVAAGCNPS